MAEQLHNAKFSHEFEDGPSGEARSYWRVTRQGEDLGTLCLHHTASKLNPQAAADSICYMLDKAFKAGGKAKVAEIQYVLNG